MIYDVIVIGGGVAGLSVAEQLHKAGLSFVILEARERAGGRINTITSNAGNRIEFGAELLHGKVPELMQVVEEANLEYYQAKDSHLTFLNGELQSADQYFEDTGEILDSMLQRTNSTDQTFSEFAGELVKEDHSLADSVKQAIGFVEDLNACYADRVSVEWLSEAQRVSNETGGDDLFRLKKGYGALVDFFLSKLPSDLIKLNHRVKAIHWKKGEVRITARSGNKEHEISGKSAVITLPASVLQLACIPEAITDDSIRFDPPLSEKVEALKSIVLGLAYRLTLEFEYCFWEKGKFENMGFIHSRNLPFTTWWSQAPESLPILIAWAAGPKADALKGKTKDELVDLALVSLSQVMHCSVSELKHELVEVHFHDWTSDPYSLGAYSSVLAGGMGAASELAKPMYQTLFFAGEATETDGFAATVPGALKSGLRAAKELIQVFRQYDNSVQLS